MKRIALTALVVLAWSARSALAVPCHGQNLPVCTFQRDYAGFQATMAAIGAAIRRIDFETLPDGSPSYGGAYITPTFNYTQLGATFSTPPVYPYYPYIGGNAQNGYSLRASSISPLVRDWLIADLTAPNRAVGAFAPGATTLRAYDDQGALIGTVATPFQGFLGIISDTPIATAVQDSGGYVEGMDDFIYSPIPEPATGLLIACGVIALRGRHR